MYCEQVVFLGVRSAFNLAVFSWFALGSRGSRSLCSFIVRGWKLSEFARSSRRRFFGVRSGFNVSAGACNFLRYSYAITVVSAVANPSLLRRSRPLQFRCKLGANTVLSRPRGLGCSHGFVTGSRLGFVVGQAGHDLARAGGCDLDSSPTVQRSAGARSSAAIWGLRAHV